jgi:hypothetical protein
MPDEQSKVRVVRRAGPVGGWTEDRTDRVKEALLAHYHGGKDLTIADYASVAGIDHRTAKRLLVELGLAHQAGEDAGGQPDAPGDEGSDDEDAT